MRTSCMANGLMLCGAPKFALSGVMPPWHQIGKEHSCEDTAMEVTSTSTSNTVSKAQGYKSP